ncbi:MAG: hypothetical protein HY021_15450 [Burkholderiales bacterium]|nr:hypothetical protein [Burkholderiales bacterium]
MKLTSSAPRSTRLALAALALAAGTANASDVNRGIEQALTTALQDKKGVTLYVSGQIIAGGVTKIEAGQWVEMRNQQWGRIIVRMDRIDGIAAP